MLQMRHEVAEQNREEYQSKHLTFGGGFDDIRRDHSNEYFGNIARALVTDCCGNLLGRRFKCQRSRARLAVDVTWTDHVDNDQPNQNRRQRRRA